MGGACAQIGSQLQLLSRMRLRPSDSLLAPSAGYPRTGSGCCDEMGKPLSRRKPDAQLGDHTPRQQALVWIPLGCASCPSPSFQQWRLE
mmetsp:Transcript_11720/g.27063  ORF Transcript_11720/g.27063 Transcript_11720/m.27063 type:complete len:89 (+) Transcript_11720:202-468(+)